METVRQFMRFIQLRNRFTKRKLIENPYFIKELNDTQKLIYEE